MRVELDDAKGIDGINELQGDHAEKVYQMGYPRRLGLLALALPVVADSLGRAGDLNSGWASTWLDPSKPHRA